MSARKKSQDSGSKSVARPEWPRLLCIALVALAVHSLCLGAPFYLDDQPHILASPRIVDPANPNAGILHGSWNIQGDNYHPGRRSATYFLWNLVHAIAGFSSTAFHALNLVLHAVLSVVVYFVAKELLGNERLLTPISSKPETVAFWAALLFAVHPLGSEVTHYAAQTSIQLATLCATMSTYFTLRWLRACQPRWAVAAAAAVAIAFLSKEVGIFHSAINLTLVLLALMPWETCLHEVRKKPVFSIAGGMGVLVVMMLFAWKTGYLRITSQVAHVFTSPDAPWHLLTQSRVFWQYAWRMFLPVHLCSDHLIPRTVSVQDTAALIAAGGLVVLLGIVALAWFRRPLRIYALLVALVASHFLLRFLYIFSKEQMVEYRVYPSLPWIAILLAVLLATAFRNHRKAANIAASTLIACFAFLCVQRSLDWQTEPSIVENIVRQYPLHIRSQSYLQALEYREGRYDDVIARQQRIENTLNTILRFNRETSHHRTYDVAHALGSFMAGEQFVGYALIAKGQPQAAINRLTEVLKTMRRFVTDDNSTGFAVLYRVRGKARAALDDRDGAREDYERALERKPHDAETLRLMEEL